ncbi:GNAT family N-acetyltransferase [Lactiplantibacillus daowaiensis]|uniref:GNAT family N-acetyltransferase n=1 Tax=Lactiplantibacillus daowaiensis TaxID=2559918 RepID=A0ABW1RZT1_9LACO|nr:GNAT family N-acetyltransferase [Lactiplantibacillus daowaiensis]
MSKAIQIRPATAWDDFEAIATLYLTVWRAAYQDQLSAASLAALTPAMWQPAKRWHYMQLAVTTDQQLVGVCTAGPARLPSWQGQSEIYSLYVLPAYQQQRVGYRLLQAALATLPADVPVKLAVLTQNSVARRFYERAGFTLTGQTKTDTLPTGECLHEQIYQLNA